MSTEKISAAVKTCLDYAVNGFGDYPFVRVRSFLYVLRGDRDWSEAEVMDVQMRLIRILMSRASRAPASNALENSYEARLPH